MSERPVSSKISLRLRLARRVRRLRVARGWSQEVLADVAGLHRTYIGSIERGERNVSLEAMERIAQALEIPLAELFSDEDTTGLYLPRIEEVAAVYGVAV